MGVFDRLASQLTQQVSATAASQVSGELSSLATQGLQNLLGINLLNNALPSNFNIDEFRVNLSAHGELAMAQKFNVVIMVPDVVQFATGTTMRELTLQCESSELPSRDINMIEYRHYGFIKRIPHNNQYGVASFNFICTGDMWEKRLFDRWLDIMIPSNSGLVTYPLNNQGKPNYECSVFINQYNTNGEPIYAAQLIDAIPTGIGALSQSWSADNHHSLPVTFAFRKWLSDSTTANVAPTDFGQAAGAPVQISPTSVSPINNSTNNNPGEPPNPFDAAVGQGVSLLKSDLNAASALKFRL